MTWWHYLLLSNLYLILFFGFYALFLRKETFFQLNRIYLVGTALLSFGIPLMQSEWVRQWFITQRVQQTIYRTGPAIAFQFNGNQPQQLNWGELITAIYLAGILVLTIRLVIQLLSLSRFMKRNQATAAWSFFQRIAVDQKIDNHDVITAHEEAHARQWHSADVLLMEAILIVCWFNPVVYLYRLSVKQIHEFIADRNALKAGTGKAEYALLLLNHTFNAPNHHLVNPFFNHSSLKQRILMLHKGQSNYRALIKYGFSVPLFVLMLVLSSATVNNSNVVKTIKRSAQQLFVTPAESGLSVGDTRSGGSDSGEPSGLDASSKRMAGTENADKPTLIHKNEVTAVAEPVTAPKDSIPPTAPRVVYTSVEETPEYNGGIRKFYEFLAENIHYPDEARAHNIQGRAIITFVVESDGSLSNVKDLRSPGYGLGEEAVRVISASPRWKPGKQHGQPVSVQYTVPVAFTLQSTATAKPDSVKRTDIPVSKPIKGAGNAVPQKAGDVKYGVAVKTTGGVKPLYIVDGKEMPDLDVNKMDLQKIASINVIKSKEAIDSYGTKASGGVISIITKK